MNQIIATSHDAWHRGFIFADDAVMAKFDRIVANGYDTLAFILDWDGVVTTKHSDGVNGTSWAILKRHMSTANQARHSELFNYFGPLEQSGQLTSEGSEFWQRQALELMIGASLSDIETDARAHAKLRPGIEQLFAVCHQAGIPIFINSAGERHVISAIADQFDLMPTYIFSNDFTLNGDIISGVHEHTLTHNLNKHTHSHRNTNGHAARNTTIVIGDNLHDAQMVGFSVEDLTLRIRIDIDQAAYTSDHGAAAWRHYVEQSFAAGYDMVVADNDAAAIVRLARAVTRQSV
jgi:phosphoserine phosphatase